MRVFSVDIVHCVDLMKLSRLPYPNYCPGEILALEKRY
jgi:hypothetical protein